jgi:hypothetical protein
MLGLGAWRPAWLGAGRWLLLGAGCCWLPLVPGGCWLLECWALAAPTAGGCWLPTEVLSAGHRGS